MFARSVRGVVRWAAVAAVLVVGGCGREESAAAPFVFLGISENEASGEGPVGLIGGETIQVNDVTRVSEASYDDYLAAAKDGAIVAETEHAGYVYWAVTVERDIPFENATAWVTVLNRYRSPLP